MEAETEGSIRLHSELGKTTKCQRTGKRHCNIPRCSMPSSHFACFAYKCKAWNFVAIDNARISGS
eukprot:scaffold85_cov358-Pavlova_lutheri.AAC.33